MKKINFRKPKYMLPLIAFLPINFLAYEVCQLVSPHDTGQKYNDLNISLPDANVKNTMDKTKAMERIRVNNDDVTGIMDLDKENLDTLHDKNIYTDEELRKIRQANEQKKAVQEQLKSLEESLRRSQSKITGTDGPSRGTAVTPTPSPSSRRADEMDSYAKEIEKLQSRALANSRRIMGLPPVEEENDRMPSQNANTQRNSPDNGNDKREKEEEKTEIVEKVADGSENFHTVGGQEAADAALIKAMIDQTTKAVDGTRLRFKLLDDVEIQGVKLPKGSYLYGNVTGFGKQRVMANVTSVLIGDQFVKVNLSVFDNDGMEGFYVPQSAFREFMRQAGSQAVNTNMNINSNGSSVISAESVALQALQNVYSSASQAVSANIRKNKARIKYGTMIYLINTKL